MRRAARHAIAQLQQSAQLDPAYTYAFYELGMAHVRNRNFSEAIANLQRAADKRTDNTPLEKSLYASGLAYALAAAGNRSEAVEILRQLQEGESKGEWAWSQWDAAIYMVYFALGEKDAALAWLEKAYQKRSDTLLYLRCWPDFDRARKDKRFLDLCLRIGIPD